MTLTMIVWLTILAIASVFVGGMVFQAGNGWIGLTLFAIGSGWIGILWGTLIRMLSPHR